MEGKIKFADHICDILDAVAFVDEPAETDYIWDESDAYNASYFKNGDYTTSDWWLNVGCFQVSLSRAGIALELTPFEKKALRKSFRCAKARLAPAEQTARNQSQIARLKEKERLAWWP